MLMRAIVSLPLAVLLCLALRRWLRPESRWARLVDLLPILFAWYGIYLMGELFMEAFRALGLYDRYDALSSAAWLAVLVCLPWGRWRAAVAALVVVAVALLALADLPHMRFFGRLLSFGAIGGGGQVWDLRASIVDLLQWRDLILLPIPLAGIVLAILWPRIPRPQSWRQWALFHLLPLAITLAVATPSVRLIARWMDLGHSWAVLDMRRWVVSKGFLASHQLDIARTIREAWIREPLSPEEVEQLRDYSAQLHRANPTHDQGIAENLNVIAIQVEAMQRWVVDAEVDGEPVMPFLRRYMQSARFYPNLWDQTNVSPTADCEYLVLNSQHPLQLGSVPFRRPNNNFVTVPKLLRDESYSTFSAHGYRAGFWNRKLVHPAYGFDESLFREQLGGLPAIGWGLADKEFLERIIPHLQNRARPWFAYLITLTSHHPYTFIPEELQELELDGLPRNWAGYLHSMRYVDRALENFITKAEAAGLLEDTLVVIFGDHDSRLVTKNRKARAGLEQRVGLPTDTTRWLLARAWETKRIPLIIKHPRETEGQVIPAYGGQMDIGVTVMHLLGKPLSHAFFGRPLVAGDPGRTVVRTDGSFVNSQVLWSASSEKCRDSTTFAEVERDRCLPFQQDAQRELKYSERITLEDAAHLLNQVPVGSPGSRATDQTHEVLPPDTHGKLEDLEPSTHEVARR